MSKIAECRSVIRDQLQASRLSLRLVARTAGLAENTVRQFVKAGRGTVDTVAAIELAMGKLLGETEERDAA